MTEPSIPNGGGLSMQAFLRSHGLQEDFKTFASLRLSYFLSQPKGTRAVSLWWETLANHPGEADNLAPERRLRLLEAFLEWREGNLA